MMTMSDEKYNVGWTDFNHNMLSSLQNLRQQGSFNNVTLVTEDGEKLFAHKFILASTSLYFHDILENLDNPKVTIFMRKTRGKIMIHISDFLYMGNASLHQDDLEDFMTLAEELKVQGLTKHGNQISPESNIKYDADEEHQNCDDPKEKQCLTQIHRNIADLLYASFSNGWEEVIIQVSLQAKKDLELNIKEMRINDGKINVHEVI